MTIYQNIFIHFSLLIKEPKNNQNSNKQQISDDKCILIYRPSNQQRDLCLVSTLIKNIQNKQQYIKVQELLDDSADYFIVNKQELIYPSSLSYDFEYGDIVYGIYYDDNMDDQDDAQVLSSIYPCVIIGEHNKTDYIKVQFFGEFAYRYIARQFLFKIDENTRNILQYELF